MKLRLVSAGLLLAGALTGCSGFGINEALCSKGQEPVWAFTTRVGAQCVKDGVAPPPGFARYPRGRVPVWINPPASYPHRTEDGRDAYNINPNNVDYPWWDEVVAEHPEFACDDTATPSGEILLRPRGGQAPRVSVLTNSVDNRCFRFDWPGSLGSVESAELAVRERGWPEPWSRTATDDASAKELLRVASDTCLRVTATLRLREPDGTLTTYDVENARVPGTCSR